MDFVKWLKNLLGCKEEYYKTVIEEKQQQIEKLNQLIYRFSNDLEKYKNKISALNNQIKTLEYQIKSLNRILEDDDSEKPNWLDDTKPYYKPKREILRPDGKIDTVEYKPEDLYAKYPSLVKYALASGFVGEDDIDKKLLSIWHFVIKWLKYQYDKFEDWRPAYITFKYRKGDCIAYYEKIYTETGLKPIKDVKVGEKVWTYNFDKQKYELKPVTKKWYKGKLQIFRTYFRNGTYIDFSQNHPMIVRRVQKYKSAPFYHKVYLTDINLTKWWTRKVPFATKLKRKIVDNPKITEDIAFLAGYYVAEGWKDGNKVSICGYNLDTVMNKFPEEYFGKIKLNKNGVPQVVIRNKFLKYILSQFGSKAINKKIPHWFKLLPDNKLNAFWSGLFLGDGQHKKSKRGHDRLVISTISKQLAYDLLEIGLYLGIPPYIFKQTNHGGLGHNPIYRLHYLQYSHFRKDYGFKDISEVSISGIVPLSKSVDMYDIEVADNHNFILWNGVITHNCEDGTILFLTLARISGIKADSIFNACGWFYTNDGRKFGHSFPIAKMSDGKWYVFETTLDFIPSKPMLFKGSNYSADWGVHNWKFGGMIKNKVNGKWQI